MPETLPKHWSESWRWPQTSWPEHPWCESRCDLHSLHHDPPSYPFLSIHHCVCLAAAQHFTHYVRAREWEVPRRKCQEVITFSGDEVEGPWLLWECEARRSEDPTQQEETGRDHRCHSNTTVDSVDEQKENRTQYIQSQEIEIKKQLFLCVCN